MSDSIPVTEGYLPYCWGRIWYRMLGKLESAPDEMAPLLMLHGRPVNHLSLKPLEALAESGRVVVLYDQLGCGRSDQPDNPDLWTVERFTEEVGYVREALGLQRLHLLGHSWGGLLAMEYALGQPPGLLSLTLISAFCNRKAFDEDFERLRQTLPAGAYETLQEHEIAGTTDDPAYKWAEKIFAQLYCCRVEPWPEWFVDSSKTPPVGHVDMQGLDITPRLGEIQVPALVACGRFDFCTPAQAQVIHQGIRGSEWVVFEHSSHYLHAEQPERCLEVVNGFLKGVEKN